MIDVSKGRIEKYILRKAFDTPDDPYLPADILWRQKEQFEVMSGMGGSTASEITRTRRCRTTSSRSRNIGSRTTRPRPKKPILPPDF